MIQGVCRFCGQTMMVDAADQDEADRKVSASCKCMGANYERRAGLLAEFVRDLSMEDPTKNFRRLTDNQTDALITIALQTFAGLFDTVSISVAESKFTFKLVINKNDEQAVRVTRKATSESAVEV